MTDCHIAYLCSLFSKLRLLNLLQTHVAAVLASQRTLTMFKGVAALHYPHVILCGADIGVPQLPLSGKQVCLNIK